MKIETRFGNGRIAGHEESLKIIKKMTGFKGIAKYNEIILSPIKESQNTLQYCLKYEFEGKKIWFLHDYEE